MKYSHNHKESWNHHHPKIPKWFRSPTSLSSKHSLSIITHDDPSSTDLYLKRYVWLSASLSYTWHVHLYIIYIYISSHILLYPYINIWYRYRYHTNIYIYIKYVNIYIYIYIFVYTYIWLYMYIKHTTGEHVPFPHHRHGTIGTSPAATSPAVANPTAPRRSPVQRPSSAWRGWRTTGCGDVAPGQTRTGIENHGFYQENEWFYRGKWEKMLFCQEIDWFYHGKWGIMLVLPRKWMVLPWFYHETWWNMLVWCCKMPGWLWNIEVLSWKTCGFATSRRFDAKWWVRMQIWMKHDATLSLQWIIWVSGKQMSQVTITSHSDMQRKVNAYQPTSSYSCLIDADVWSIQST